MIFEFWEKIEDQDTLIGISKVSLHQFYVAFRNPVITKYLSRNKLPVIGCDRVEPICNPLNGEIYGQVEILVALGTDVQIHSLKHERGFESELVTAKPPQLQVNKQRSTNDLVVLKSNIRHKNLKIFKKTIDSNKKEEKNITEEPQCKKKTSTKNKFTNTNKEPAPEQLKSKRNLVDVAIQSDVNMADSQDKRNDVNVPPTSDVLGAFLTQLLQQKQKNYVENSTNTGDKQNITMEEQNSNMDSVRIRRTSDLLDSLQQALSINNLPDAHRQRQSQSVDTFKAHVIIENALHLPSRKKCIVRTVQGKPHREELLPSPFVTFETSSQLKVTPVVQENKNPEWDYGCDVELPADLLTNNQKRLIFKVWKKLVNAPPFEPNFDSDTILGFAALDLTVLLAGMPTVSGWFNIVDFSNKCNGQIKISVTPLENLNRFIRCKTAFSTSLQQHPVVSTGINKVSHEVPVENIEEPGELLSRALKRKFTELDEITQRLKLRLSH
ncbi:C2 domain containing protein, partial [Oryctes borbonicus]